MTSKTQNSLADKINALITTKPTQFGSDDEAEETKAKVVERYDENEDSDNEFRQSTIRKQNVDTLDKIDERYAGKKVSRKDIHSDEDDGSASEATESEGSKDMEDTQEESDELDTDEEMDSQEESDELDTDEEMDSQKESNELDNDEEMDSQTGSEDAESISGSEEQDEHNVDISNPLYRQRDFTIKTISDTNIRVEMEKGNCVRNQLKLWENLLEVRIKLQKCLVTSNQMPQYDAHKVFRSDTNFVKKVDEVKIQLASILNNMLHMKDLLLKQYPETKILSTGSKKRKLESTTVNDSMDEEIPSDTEEEVEDKEEKLENEEETSADKQKKESVPRKRLKYKDYEKVLKTNHNSYTEYRNSIIRKWNEKTRIASGTFNKDLSKTYTTLKQIEFAMNDMKKLRKRTQLKRSDYIIVGKSSPDDKKDTLDLPDRRFQEYDPEIYDDDDFYHQLLRDLIEYKSSDMTDPIQLSKQWIKLQNMRRKMKRKIDTRATKGRRVRYNIHNKLVNFMAPITVYDTWTDPAKDDLYNSLFGKIKSIEERTNQ